MISYDSAISLIIAITAILFCFLGINIGHHSACIKFLDYFLHKNTEQIDYYDVINAVEYAQGKRKL